MENPPFAASSLVEVIARQSGADASHPSHAPILPARRARLADLDSHYHCSVIGTCLGTTALRKVMRRLSAGSNDADSDLDVHHDAVSVAIEGGAGAKALTKALDEHHAATLRRFAAALDSEALARLWADALKTGEVPGAYWALMTHPQVNKALQNRAFGDVHMLSHLVGAANRADIRRLVALEKSRGELQAQCDDLQTRLQEATADRDEQVAQLRLELAEARGQAERMSTQLSERSADAAAMHDGAGSVSDRLARHAARREQSEREALAAIAAQDDALGRLDRMTAMNRDLHDEVRSLERELAQAGASASDASASPLGNRLRGLRLLYVGGRPSTLTTIRALAERAGAEWLHHDGGMEDRKGLLAATLPRAHCVVFPVDCIDHDSMQQLKRLCARHDLPYRPLRTASVASFVAAMSTQDDDTPLANGAALASRFCVRHG